jgi:membrane protein YdbS with pleckstrin-like domain
MSSHEQEIWYYGSAEGERVGPLSIRELSSLANKGTVGPKTLVWSPGQPDWIPAEQIAELLMGVREAVPTVPAPSPEEPVAVKESVTEPVAVAPVKERPTPVETTAATAAPASSEPPLELQPMKGSFVFPRIVLGVLLSLLLGGATAGILIAVEQAPWPALAVFGLGSLLAIMGSLVAYRKERYELHESRVLCHRGGLMSDQTTELEIRNVTHVKLKLPWLRFKFYGVGDVIIESAGNSQPVVMRAIREPEAIYDAVRDRMKRNGYDLTQQQLYFEDKPALIGIIAECIGTLLGSSFALIYAGVLIMGAREAAKSPVFDAIALGVLGLAAILVITFVIVRLLDYSRRTYRVFNDMVVYDEGFLTRHNAFIPYENIADATTNCTMIDRLFGLYDVQVSCQGNSKEIKFRRLRQGAALSAAIDQLVVLAREKKKKPTAKAAHASQIRPRREEPAAVPAGEAMVAELRMHAGRTIVPLLLLLPLVPIWLSAIIRVISTQYSVRPGSVRHAYRFLTLTDREFAYDKITGVVVKQNLWDRMFGTLTIKFWSIGSGQPIEFAHVDASKFDVTALMRQVGIPAPSAEPHEVLASCGLFTWLSAQLKFLPLFLLAVGGFAFAGMELDPVLYYLTGLPVVVLVGSLIFSMLRASRQRLRFHDHHVEAETGIIAKRFYLARYSNIKRTTVTRYPGSEKGDLQIFVAGEEEYQHTGATKQQQRLQKIMRPCSFTTRYLPNVRETALLFDDILCGRVDPVPNAVPDEPFEVLAESPRSVANAVTRLLLFSILLVVPIVLLPLTLPFTILRVKRWRYRVDAARIVANRGILYRSESSILLDRVDSLQQSQGPLNKMFKNGNVTIMTAGSSKPDFKIIDAPGYLELYRIIRERSE